MTTETEPMVRILDVRCPVHGRDYILDQSLSVGDGHVPYVTSVAAVQRWLKTYHARCVECDTPILIATEPVR